MALAGAQGSAHSFCLAATSPSKVARALEASFGKVERPQVGLVFATGELAAEAATLAREIARLALGAPILLGTGAGVLNETSELERESGASGLVWAGGKPRVLALDPRPGDVGRVLGDTLRERPRDQTAFVLLRADRFEPGLFSGVPSSRPVIFGGGTPSDVFTIDERGHVTRGTLGILSTSASLGVLKTTRGCRMVSPLRPVTRVRGPLLLEIGGEPALDVLSVAGANLEEQPLIFVALARSADVQGSEGRMPERLLRPIQGVDPSRRGVVVGEEISSGEWHAGFTIRDASAARADMEALSRDVLRASAGAAPRFGLYVNCAGRGSNLYGATGVDTRILRTKLGNVPIAGFQSAFELTPFHGALELQLYTGVFGLFTSPS
jgi:small ligand-binding sensory domain FIST